MFQRRIGRAQAGEYARHILIAYGHDDRRSCRLVDRSVGRRGSRNGVAVAAEHQQDETHDGRPETGGHPEEEDGKQRQDGHLHGAFAVIGQHRHHRPGSQHTLTERQRGQHAAAQDASAAARGWWRRRRPGLVAERPHREARGPAPRDHGTALDGGGGGQAAAVFADGLRAGRQPANGQRQAPGQRRIGRIIVHIAIAVERAMQRFHRLLGRRLGGGLEQFRPPFRAERQTLEIGLAALDAGQALPHSGGRM